MSEPEPSEPSGSSSTSGISRLVRSWYRALRVMGSDPTVVHGPARAVNAARRRVADPTRAAEGLGFRAEVTLEEGLRRLVAWWRAEQPAP